MLVDYSNIKHIYLMAGKTDLRLGIDGLALRVQEKYQLDLYDEAVFLFCGNRRDRFKILYWDNNGFYLIYKRLDTGVLQWPRHSDEAITLSNQQLRWLLEGLSIVQKTALKAGEKGRIF